LDDFACRLKQLPPQRERQVSRRRWLCRSGSMYAPPVTCQNQSGESRGCCLSRSAWSADALPLGNPRTGWSGGWDSNPEDEHVSITSVSTKMNWRKSAGQLAAGALSPPPSEPRYKAPRQACSPMSACRPGQCLQICPAGTGAVVEGLGWLPALRRGLFFIRPARGESLNWQ